ncbi:SIMPL domain-containing protein [Arcobacter sp. CECT 8986]|uniref:SIMPL domain-containing protein n=1 Tax=Arcobacter sp. CECT 8986 TaxID=2044507 RepID=UPI001009FE6A|nr:SIMPL domain-containing protein [Arcobacter sp. CECT 8986]RXJ98030.1 SIMPL domain-containing protein [Arcobacter sp. CECT 8986]
MKKFLLGTALSVLPLFSYDIHFNKSFEDSIKPDTLTTKLSIIVEAKKESSISNTLTKFNTFIKDVNSVDKNNGSLYIRPKYIYKDKSSQIDGYVGELNYDIASKDSKNINGFLSKILSIKKDDKTSIRVSNLSWKISQKSSENIISNLRIDSIIWAKDYANSLSKQLNSTCKVKEININSLYNPSILRMETRLMSAKSQANNLPIPDNSEKNIKLNANYTLECN